VAVRCGEPPKGSSLISQGNSAAVEAEPTRGPSQVDFCQHPGRIDDSGSTAPRRSHEAGRNITRGAISAARREVLPERSADRRRPNRQ